MKYLTEDLTVPNKNLIFQYTVETKWFDGIKYILENNIECDLPSLTTIGLRFTNMEVLKYCKDKGLKWETRNVEEHFQILKCAASENDLDCFEWIFNDPDLRHDWSSYLGIRDIAPYFGYREDLLEYLYEIGFMLEGGADIFEAITAPNLEML